MAQELAAQPYLRQFVREEYKKYAYLSTIPTEKGKKELNIFHPLYRTK